MSGSDGITPVTNYMEGTYQITLPEREVELVGDDGEVLREVTVGTVVSNSTSEARKITVKNVTPQEFRNVIVTVGELKLVSNTYVEISSTPAFDDYGRGINIRRLLPGEEQDIYVRVKSLGGGAGEGSFKLIVLKEAVVE